MEDLNRVFLPLRSNIGWFHSSNLLEDISNRVKESILLYDELYIEDCTFISDTTEVGSTIIYASPGIPYELRTNPSGIDVVIGKVGSKATRSVFMGNSIARLNIDYYSIFECIDISDYDFLKFIVLPDDEIPEDITNEIARLNNLDEDSFYDIYSNMFLRDLVVHGLNHDLVVSSWLNSAVIIDPMHENILNKKCWNPESTFSTKPVFEHVALNNILEVTVPSLSSLSIEKVLELRDDRSWCNFRDFVRDTVATVKDDPEILIDQHALEKALHSQYEKALFEELERKYPTGSKLLVDLGLGALSCIPGYGLISAALGAFKSSKCYWDGKSAWFAFLLKLKSASKP